MTAPECTCAAKDMPFGACCRVQQERFRVWPDGTEPKPLQPSGSFCPGCLEGSAQA